MSFGRPLALLLLLILPAAAGLLQHSATRDRRLMRLLRISGDPVRSYLVLQVLWSCMLGSLVMILAQPHRPLPAVGGELLHGTFALVLDVSGSMDARPSPSSPSLLDQARGTAHDLIDLLPEARFQIFAFAGLAFPVSHATVDRTYLEAVLDDTVLPDAVPAGGSSLGNALGALVSDSMGAAGITHAVILTDGDVPGEQRSRLASAVALVQRTSLPVTIVGFGTTEGLGVPLLDASGAFTGSYAETPTVLRPELLREVAAATGGRYFSAADTRRLTAYLRSQLAATAQPRGIGPTGRDLAPLFRVIFSAGLAALLLLFGRLY